MFEAEFDFARSEDKDCHVRGENGASSPRCTWRRREKDDRADAVEAIEDVLREYVGEIRSGREGPAVAPEPSQHVAALVEFAERAYRRPLSEDERDDLLAFYTSLRTEDDLEPRGSPPRRAGQRADVAALLLPLRSRPPAGSAARPADATTSWRAG